MAKNQQNSIDVLYEDNHLIAINKKPGDLVQGDKTGDQPLSDYVKAYIKKKYNKPGDVFLGTVHRIDRPVSGVVVFARTSKALTRLNALFQEKSIQKVYWAMVGVIPDPEKGTLEHYMLRDSSKNKSKAHQSSKAHSKKATLSYKTLLSLDRYHLLEVLPLTGRHHQIRAQLSAIGSPIKGDIKYGFARTNRDASIHLHARSIAFIHPVLKTSLTITASPPKEQLWDVCMERLSS
jgi:23S rRNA pseudouridine1911/1915/1917 synthase